MRPLRDTEVRVGERLRRIAYSKGWQLKTLAAALNSSSAHVSRMFCGQRRFTPQQLDKFLDALEVEEHLRVVLHRHAAMEYGFKIDERRGR